MKRRRIQRKHNFKFSKPLIGIFIGLILGAIMFWIFSRQEDSEWIAESDLEIVSGIISEYQYYDRSWSKAHQSVSRYEISIEGQGTYVLSNVSSDNFDMAIFEQTAEASKNATLSVDKDVEKTAFKDGEIYEIWIDEVCYFSYEEYVEAHKDFYDESKSAKWPLSIGMFCIGIIVAIDIWLKERKH